MPDLKNYNPAVRDEVKAGGVIYSTLGAGAAPAIAFGSGAPTLSAPKGSIYLRTDGSSTSNRLYVNTDAGTTWTAATTAA